MTAGVRLRAARLRLGLTTRDVATFSRRIAHEEGNTEYALSHARLVQIEQGTSTPSIYKLFSLSAAYGVPIKKLLSLYMNPDAATRCYLLQDHKTTHLMEEDESSELESETTIEFPSAFRESATLQRTSLLSELITAWEHVPLQVLRHLNLRRCRYGVIGLNDYMMYPLLRPGSFVQLADQQRPERPHAYHSEFERPIYFIEQRSGYLCCWCELRDDRLVAIPHPLSPCRVMEFRHPDEAQIVGRVVAVAARLHNTPHAVEDPLKRRVTAAAKACSG
jgi:transcriptional regulator with XRE-family HTH domain